MRSSRTETCQEDVEQVSLALLLSSMQTMSMKCLFVMCATYWVGRRQGLPEVNPNIKTVLSFAGLLMTLLMPCLTPYLGVGQFPLSMSHLACQRCEINEHGLQSMTA